MKLAHIIRRYRSALEDKYGSQLLPGQRRALDAISRCRTPASGEMLVRCPDCGEQQWLAHSCGHRSCPCCQNHETTRWLERQRKKLLPVYYYLITFTIPAVLRNCAWANQRLVYNLMFKASIETMREQARKHRHLGAEIGATGVLHTNSRRLDYHPHIHYVVPGGGIDSKHSLWKKKRGKYLIPAPALSYHFRKKLLKLFEENDLPLPAGVYDHDWVVDVERCGSGEPCLEYLSRYLYRGVISERNIADNDDGTVTFTYKESKTGAIKSRTLPGEDFLWLISRHNLPKGFRRSRDYGFLHGNAKKTLGLIQILLAVVISPPEEKLSRPSCLCKRCKVPMQIVRIRVFRELPEAQNRGSPYKTA